MAGQTVAGKRPWVCRLHMTCARSLLTVWKHHETLILGLLSVVFPPLAVFFRRGCGASLAINLVLTLTIFIPGMAHALVLVCMTDPSVAGPNAAKAAQRKADKAKQRAAHKNKGHTHPRRHNHPHKEKQDHTPESPAPVPARQDTLGNQALKPESRKPSVAPQPKSRKPSVIPQPVSSAVDPVADPVTEPVKDVVDPVAEPVTDAVEPAAEPVTDAVDPVAEPVTDALEDPPVKAPSRVPTVGLVRLILSSTSYPSSM